MAPNGTRFGGWLLNTADNTFGPGADYDGDGKTEILVTSPWGIGILEHVGSTMAAPMMQPNGTRFGGWLLNTPDNRFGSGADYDGDSSAEILGTSPWGVGILEQVGNKLPRRCSSQTEPASAAGSSTPSTTTSVRARDGSRTTTKPSDLRAR